MRGFALVTLAEMCQDTGGPSTPPQLFMGNLGEIPVVDRGNSISLFQTGCAPPGGRFPPSRVSEREEEGVEGGAWHRWRETVMRRGPVPGPSHP